MRVLHLTHQYLPEKVGGVELYTHWLARAQVARGHDVAVFYRASASGTGCVHRTDAGIDVWQATDGVLTASRRFLSTFYSPHLLECFVTVLDEFKPEFVHVQHLMGLPYAIIETLIKRGIPYMVTLHDFWWQCANAQLLTNYSQELCQGPQPSFHNCARCALARAGGYWQVGAWALAPLLAWRNRLLTRVLHAAAALVASTPFVLQWYAAHHALSERLHLLPLGMPWPEKLPARQREANGRVRFLYVGGLSYQKGLHVVLEAFRGLPPEAELWIAGDEQADPDYVALLRSMATANVRFLGRLTREAVWAVLVDADVVVVPALWYETFSFLISEAFAARKPVLASRIGALADRVNDGVDGMLLPPGDVAAWRKSMQGLLESPDKIEILRSGVGTQLSMDEHVDDLDEILNGVLVTSSSARGVSVS
ncbi:MAG: glycosyltransferase [Anaerolineae bacterium]|nr:glycosyltransferase [Anaerolineae bacterium]